MILIQVIDNNRFICALIFNHHRLNRFRINILIVCLTEIAHEYRKNKVEAYLGQVQSLLGWICTFIPEYPVMVQDHYGVSDLMDREGV